MTNIMGVPSVSVYTQNHYGFNQTQFIFELKMGGGICSVTIDVTNEVMLNMDEHGLKLTIAEEVAQSFHKKLPWLDSDWVFQQFATILETGTTNVKPIKASAGTHDKSGAYSLPGPALAEWEKELLAESKKKKINPDYKPKPTSIGISGMADGLPGMKAFVLPPCGCYEFKTYLKDAIMHINDDHAGGSNKEFWSSDRLCDWLDELHDSGVVDLEVQIPDKENK